MSKNEFVEVFSGDLWQAQIIEGLLHANEIGCILKDKNLPGIIPAYGPMGYVVVYVAAENEEIARRLIAEGQEK